MRNDPVVVQPFQGQRVRVESERAFEEVLATLRRLVPKSIPPSEYPGAMEKAGGLNLKAFKAGIGPGMRKRLHALLGD